LYFGTPYPRVGTGNWTTGYVQPKGSTDLIIFMNIGVLERNGDVSTPNRIYLADL
jgi:hypothetical protein